METIKLAKSPLGKPVSYVGHYNPTLIFPIPRKTNRDAIGVPDIIPFDGVDIWNGYELSWLNPRGKPEVAIVDFYVPCTSLNIFESKSFKLYLNSFNQTKFDSIDEVKKALVKDTSYYIGKPVEVILKSLQDCQDILFENPVGTCLDDLDIEVDTYELEPNFLKADGKVVEEKLYSNLLKSNCLMTSQPDWGTIMISYKGPKIDHEGLLKYIISYRNINEFAEQCVERIFMDILKRCKPSMLTVYARYTRRGGLDINPFRTMGKEKPSNVRFPRQ